MKYRSLEEWRKANGLSQEKAGQLFGMAQGHWSVVEDGSRPPRPKLAKRIADRTGVSVVTILGLE